MADIKISALGAIASVAGEDLVAIVDDPSGTPASRKATIDQIKTYIGGITASSTDTLTNKSVSLTTNTLTGTSLELKTAISDETGSGALVFATSPTLVTPALGTPASGVATNITGLPLAGLVATTVSRALVSTAGGVISPATTTSAEIGYVNGVTSAIQTQIDLKSPLASPTFTGTVVLPNSQALVTPVLGTPTSGTLTNCTIPANGLTYDINAQTGTTYTFVLGDAGDIVTSNNAGTVVMTIPPNSSVAYPIGSSITVISIGAGLTNFAQGAGVTINSTGAVATAPVLRIQHSSATAIKVDTDTWQVVGDIA